MFRIFPRTVTVLFLIGVFFICLGLALRTSAHPTESAGYSLNFYRH